MLEGNHSCRVLSIQSHVVSGCVGNKAAVFPLQLLGFDVDFVNSVQFSNHTGYPTRPKGTVLTGTELSSLSAGLQENNIMSYDYLLTGYIGSETFLHSVLEVLDTIKQRNPHTKYVCDPVLGDHNQYYVPAALVDIFRTQLIPRAYMITPNQFEAELLTGIKIHSEEDAERALVALHRLGPQVVVLTSAELSSPPTAADSVCSAERSSSSRLHCYVLYPTAQTESTEDTAGEHSSSSSDRRVAITRFEIDKIEGNYTGTGDVTAALMLAWVHTLTNSNIDSKSSSGPARQQAGEQAEANLGDCANSHSAALRNALATVRAMISRSSERVKQLALHRNPATDSSTDQCALIRARELQVVQSKRDIEQPPLDQLPVRSTRTWTVHC